MIYFISLAIVSIIFINHMMKFDFLIIGIAWILLFFLLSYYSLIFITSLKQGYLLNSDRVTLWLITMQQYG